MEQDHDVDDNEQPEEQDGPDTVIAIHSVGCKFSYNIPSFPALSAMLRSMKFEWIGEDGTVSLMDGFIKDCSLLDRTYPAFASPVLQ